MTANPPTPRDRIADIVSKFWCHRFHAGGTIERDSMGRINWQCSTCGRWSEYPVPIEDEHRMTAQAMAQYYRNLPAGIVSHGAKGGE